MQGRELRASVSDHSPLLGALWASQSDVGFPVVRLHSLLSIGRGGRRGCVGDAEWGL